MNVWLIALIVLVVGRLLVFQDENRASPRRIVIVGILQLCSHLLLFHLDKAGILSVIGIFLAGFVLLLTEQSLEYREHFRTLLLLGFAAGLALPVTNQPLTLKAGLGDGIGDILQHSVFTLQYSRFDPKSTLALVLGLLLCLEEANILLRVTLKGLAVLPPVRQPSASGDELPAMRSGLIGSIERVLIFIFVMHGAYNAISFVIAVKGIARFNEMSNNESAEYILIGSLLSALAAIGIGLAVLQA